MASGPRARGGERRPPRLAWAVVLLLCLSPGTAAAEERFVLIVSGASGAQEYAATFSEWTTELARTLTHRFNLDASRLVVLSESDDATVASTAANVRRAITLFQRRMTRDDVLLVVLIGHGTFDGIDAKFNLVGPDLEAAQWAALLDPVPGRVVLVNTTAASFPFLERLAGPRRVVIAATDSPAQRYQTVFPEYFIKAFADEAADLDKNGRVSIWEAFAAASAGVRRHYQQRGQLSTERGLLDDSGDGVGGDAGEPGENGSLASRIYLDVPMPGAAPTDDVLLKLLQRKATLEADVEDLKIRRTFLPGDEYAAEFERLMIELARVSRDVRERVKS
ncbi:hypothetical protein BH23ACI1_BH23ACI1_10630 [soil metagenome]